MMYQIAPERRLAYRAIVFLVAIAAALAFGLLATNSPHSGPEMGAEDSLMRLAPAQARPDIVLVTLDAASVAKYGPVAAWPRSVLADGLRRVEAGGPKAVVMDLALNKRTQTGDAALWREMANGGNVVLGMAYDASRQPPYTADDVRAWRYLQKFAFTSALTFGPQTQVFPYLDFEPPVSDFTGSARGVGVFERETDPDGVLRDARLFYLSQVQEPNPLPPLPGKFPPSSLAAGTSVALANLALAAAQPIFGLDKNYVVIRAGRTVHLAGNLHPGVNPPVDRQGRMQIRFAGPAGRFPAVSFADVVSGKVKSDEFHNRVVLIGATAPGDPATDLRQTPFGFMPRVEVTANVLSTLMNRSYFTLLTTRPHRALGILLVVGLVVGGILMFFSGVRALLVAGLLLIVYLALCWGFFASGAVMLPILPGILTILTALLVSVLLALGPFRPVPVPVSPTYVPPPSDVVH